MNALDMLYQKALSATNPKVRAALFRAWHKAKSRPEGDTLPPVIPQSTQYATFCDAVRSCTRCPLAQTRTQAVPGEGPSPADIMLIGEGPGAQEDRAGRPFVGPAGRLLDELLTSIGWARSRVYITNTVACRPPGNRTPDWSEVTACSPHLVTQIKMVQPRLIVTLGATALSWFDRTRRITSCHGQPFKHYTAIGERWIFPLYHPAAALRSPVALRQLREDVQELARFAQRVAPTPIAWREFTPAGARKEAARYNDRGWVVIYSEVLREPIVLARDSEVARSAPAGIVVYTEEEVRLLAAAGEEDLRQVHEIKRFANGRVTERHEGR